MGAVSCVRLPCCSSGSCHRKTPCRASASAWTTYLSFGTGHVWVVDPELRKAHLCTKTGMEEPADGVLAIAGTEIRVVLSELFAELDRA
ncbi:MAG TPA: hypothetical protein VK729_11585 [Silvibacterium sp.]|nr:hypothetical protein [Silvibacterium sp.]